jgi:hypothetical protein
MKVKKLKREADEKERKLNEDTAKNKAERSPWIRKVGQPESVHLLFLGSAEVRQNLLICKLNFECLVDGWLNIKRQAGTGSVAWSAYP